MAPFEAAATFAKRVSEDSAHALDLAKQNFAIWETYYEKDRLRAEIAAKDADGKLIAAQEKATTVTNNVTVNINGKTELDHMAIVDAVYAGITQAAKDAKPSATVMSPKLGGSRYAA